MKAHQQEEVIIYVMRFIPALCIFAWIALSHTLHLMPSLANAWPPLSYAFIFFCAAFAPRMLPYSVLIVLGVAHDVLSLQPIGMSALLFCAMRILVTTQGRLITSLPFTMQWATFSIALLTLLLAEWIMMSLYLSTAFNMHKAVFPWLAASACYPLLHLPLYRIYTRIGHFDARSRGWS